MTDTWGELPKSQTDNSTVDQEIDSKIQDHLDDPDAHIETGQSLQSHKASEIIDHLAGSIVNDKLAANSVTPDKLYYNKFFVHTTFESLDAFFTNYDDATGTALLTGDGCLIRSCDVVGDKAYIGLETIYLPVNKTLDPLFQVVLYFPGDEDLIDAAFMCGPADPFDTGTEGFGFIWKGAQQKMYTRTRIDAVLTDTEITGFVASDRNILRAELVNADNSIYFYLNDTLVLTVDCTDITLDSNDILALGSKALDTTGLIDVVLISATFQQNLA